MRMVGPHLKNDGNPYKMDMSKALLFTIEIDEFIPYMEIMGDFHEDEENAWICFYVFFTLHLVTLTEVESPPQLQITQP